MAKKLSQSAQAAGKGKTVILFPKAFLLIAFVSFLLVQNVYSQVPTITGYAPTSGPVGSTVIITGTNFNTTPANNVVFFGATRAIVSAAAATQLSVTVPTGATHDYITVLNTATGLLAYTSTKFIPTYTPNTGTITAEDFSASVSFPVDTWFNNLAVGDLDGDGKIDVAVAVNTVLSVLRNTSTVGNVDFAPKVDFPTINQTRLISIGDVDGDGKLDLVSVFNGFDNPRITVFRNTSTVGNISFADKVDFALDNPLGGPVAIGDIDGDGRADIVTAGFGNVEISIFRNTGTVGTINFAPRVDINSGFLYHYKVVIGDLDSDGKPDVVVTNRFSSVISVLRNISTVGTINFEPAIHFASEVYIIDLSIGDLDGDGMLDLAAISYEFGISIYKNISIPGTIIFDDFIETPISPNSSNIPIADIDGDGKLDLLMADESYNHTWIFKNISTVGNINVADHVVLNTGKILKMSIADVDGDGLPDILGAGTNTVDVYRKKPVLLSVSDVDDSSNFTVYPNPTNKSIFIKNNQNNNIKHIEIIDVSGRIIQSIEPNFENEVSLDVSSLSSGNYIIKLQSEKGKAIKKFIKI